MRNRVQLSKVRYLGGHEAEKPFDGAVLVVDDGGVHVRRLTEKFVVPWGEVTGVVVEGPEQASKRVTVTRLATIGIFAFAAKKSEGAQAYLELTTRAGEQVAFVVPKMAAGELRGKLAPWAARLLGHASPTETMGRYGQPG